MKMTAQIYINEYMPTIQGWLLENACFVTECLLQSQNDLDIRGVNAEIGVWKGKYLALITLLTPDRTAHAFDVYLHNQQEEVGNLICGINNDINIKTHRINSFDISLNEFTDLLCNESIAFASIDGSHEAEAVINDLMLVDQNLSRGGIIAIDDYFNPLTFGVTEGVNKYLEASRLSPICYCSNKLFLTTHGWSDLYQIRLRMWLESGAAKIIMNTELPNWAERTTKLFGHSVLILAP